MNKEILMVLVVDRSLKHTELVASLENYRRKGYDIFILPSTRENEETEVVIFNNTVVSILEQLFIIEKLHNNGDPFFCFEFKENGENGTQNFYTILNKEFEVTSHNLTKVEK